MQFGVEQESAAIDVGIVSPLDEGVAIDVDSGVGCVEGEVTPICGSVEGGVEDIVDEDSTFPGNLSAVVDVESVGVKVGFILEIEIERSAGDVEVSPAVDVGIDATVGAAADDGSVVVQQLRGAARNNVDKAVMAFEGDDGVAVVGECSLSNADVAGGCESDGIVVVEIAVVGKV